MRWLLVPVVIPVAVLCWCAGAVYEWGLLAFRGGRDDVRRAVK